MLRERVAIRIGIKKAGANGQEQAEEKLRESEAFLESIVENIPNMIFVKDAETLKFIRFNKAGEDLLGVSRDSMIGRTDYDLFPKEQADAFIAGDRDALRVGVMVDIPEEPIFTPHGIRTLHTKKIPLLDVEGNPRYLLGISEDITVKKELEEQRVRLLVEQQARADAEMFNAELKKERERREDFVATLAHDLRNPLAAARMGAEMLGRNSLDEETRKRLVEQVVVSVERTDQMIRDLLDVTLIRAGSKIPVTIEECDLRRVVEGVIAELRMLYGDRFTVDCPGDLPGYWSASGIHRLVENLAGNAVKYGSEDTKITVGLRAEALSDEVSISVHNDGNPIPEEEQQTMFEPFRRTQASRKSGQKGWGLGLLLVRGITDAHGGRLEVESSPEKGTTFRVSLPRDARTQQLEA